MINRNNQLLDHDTCQKCVLPNSKLFKLDKNGECTLCSSPSHFKHIQKKPNTDKLEKIIQQIRDNGKSCEFDCVVAWSGGRDSTFMLHELVTKYKLRCVAVFGKTPFTPFQIIENVKTISEKLHVKLVEIHTPSNHQEIAGYCIKEYLRTKKPILVNLACAPCKFVNQEIFKQAKLLKTKSVVYGGNRFEYFPLAPASIDINLENRYSFCNMLLDNILRFVKGLSNLFESPKLFKYLITFFKASVLYVNQYTIFLRLRYSNIYRFDYFHFADWDEDNICEVLKAMDWKLPPGCNSTWRADCVFEAVKNSAFKERLGFTYTQAMYSNLIRAGKVNRETALKRLSIEGISEPRLHEALKLCGLPSDAFNETS
jgi:hypothetical protein